jgi:hypothetical protein
MPKRSLVEEVLGLAKTLKVDDKLEGLRDEDLREVDLETAVALGMERPKAAKIACRIRSACATVTVVAACRCLAADSDERLRGGCPAADHSCERTTPSSRSTTSCGLRRARASRSS